MSSEFRGGNSRLLAKGLDELKGPLAILDWQGEIVFANSSLCQLANTDATQLVGKRCSWQVAADDTPLNAILTGLAPPATALEGGIVARQLTTPIVFGSTSTGQLFVPIRDSDPTPTLILVILGEWEKIQAQVPVLRSYGFPRPKAPDEVLVRLRSQWAHLDHLVALLGESPAIQLAMRRAQLALQHDGNFLVTGPIDTGKSEIVKGVFYGRLKRLGLQRIAGQYFPIECAVMDATLVQAMLDLFTGRVRADFPKHGQLLVLEEIDQLEDAAVNLVDHWLESHASIITAAATSQQSLPSLMSRGPGWNRLLSRLASVEIFVPALSDRKEDVPILAQQCLAAACAKMDRSLVTISSDAMEWLTAYSWPNNLAELQQSIETALQNAIFSSAIQVQHLPVAIRVFAGSGKSIDAGIEPIVLDDVLAELERIIISRAIKLSPRNRAQVARWLGISRPRLLRRLAQLGLQDANDPQGEEE